MERWTPSRHHINQPLMFCRDRLNLGGFMKSPILSRQEQKNLVKQAKTEWTVLSFYRYTEIKNPVNFADRLREGWSALGVLGRV